MKLLRPLLLVLCFALLAPLAGAQVFEGNVTQDPANSGRRRIEILRAHYGARGYRPLDVTYQLQNLVNSGLRAIIVDNKNMGADPAPGVVKSLHVKYRVGGRSRTQTVGEGAVFSPGR